MKVKLSFEDAIVTKDEHGDEYCIINEILHIGIMEGEIMLTIPKKYADPNSEYCRDFFIEVNEKKGEWKLL